MAYPDTLLRGLITPGSVTSERYVTAEAFQFQDFRQNRSDNYKELSINWEDSDEAVDVLLKQKKEGSEDPQFKIGFARMSFSRIKDVLKPHISDKTYSYERKPIDGNPYHGNLLADEKLPRQIVKNIQHSLATIATADVYLRSDENIKYLKKENITMPKVSVIVPVYGVEKYIERCARSLFEQTLEDIEFIFVDDCTPDKSIEILKNVLEDYPQRKKQVKIERHEKNRGLPIARQSGLKVASGDYIIHCDSDDWVDVTMYEKMYNKAIEEGSDVVVCGYNRHDGCVCLSQKCGITNISNDLGTNIWDCVYDKTPWSVCNKLIKRLLWEGLVYPQYNMGEDMCIILQLYSTKQPKISYVDQYLYYYFDNPESIMNKMTEEITIRNFKQLKENVDCLVTGLKKNGTYLKNKKYTDYLYYRASNILLPYIKNDSVFEIWRNHFKSRNFSILSNRNITVARKIRHLLIMFRLYQ